MSEEAKKPEAAADPGPGPGPGPGSDKTVKLGLVLSLLNFLLILGIGGVVFMQFQKDKHKESVADIQPGAHGEFKADAKAEDGHGEAKADAKSDGHGDGHGVRPLKRAIKSSLWISSR